MPEESLIFKKSLLYVQIRKIPRPVPSGTHTKVEESLASWSEIYEVWISCDLGLTCGSRPKNLGRN